MFQNLKQLVGKYISRSSIQAPLTEVDYRQVYENLYQNGYHSDLEFSNAKDLVGWLKQNLEFESVLDVGCSNGWALEQFAQQGKTVSGIDPAQTAVDYCLAKNIHAVVGCSHELPFESNQFDVVMSTDCLEHIRMDDVPATIDELHRVAKKWIALKICPNVDVGDWKKLPGHDLHLTVQPIQWWMRKFLAPGGKQVYFDDRDTFVIDVSS